MRAEDYLWGLSNIEGTNSKAIVCGGKVLIVIDNYNSNTHGSLLNNHNNAVNAMYKAWQEVDHKYTDILWADDQKRRRV